MHYHDAVLMAHGSGGALTRRLTKDLIARTFQNEMLAPLADSAIVTCGTSRLAFSTDSYVVDPIVFPGGDIGKLAVCGTINDLCVMGAIPDYLSCGLIIEEGFPVTALEKILRSMQKTARKSNVEIVTGDTKVVNRGSAHKIFVNTAGIGTLRRKGLSRRKIKPGDKIIVNGTIGDHGIAVITAREAFNIKAPIKSDCAALDSLIHHVLDAGAAVKFMRDPTRGGIASALNEFVEGKGFGICLYESEIPVNPNVSHICDLLGFDPLYIANEGKVLFVVATEDAEDVVRVMKTHPLGKKAAIIGEIIECPEGRVLLETIVSGHRIVDMMVDDQFPRIC